jgi:hypothetical protein
VLECRGVSEIDGGEKLAAACAGKRHEIGDGSFRDADGDGRMKRRGERSQRADERTRQA